MTTLTLTRLPDPLLERSGTSVASRYAEVFWLPVLGPSALWVLRHTAMNTTTGPYVVDADVLARCVGIDPRVLMRTLERLVTFHCAIRVDEAHYSLRAFLPPLTARQLARLPRVLRDAHDTYTHPERVGALVAAS